VTRPTVNDIARAAGVSLATVDRVLNARPGVRGVTIKKVNDAIQKLGYVRDVSAANLARRRQYRLMFFLPEGQSQFTAALHNALAQARATAAIDRTDIDVVRVPPNDPHALAETLNAVDCDDVDGVAIMAAETPQARDAVRHLKENGVAVVTLVSDLPNTLRDHFVGINNIAAGRTAGVLMGRFVGPNPCSVAIFSSSMQLRDSVERRLGFDQVMAESFPWVNALPSIESHDDPEIMARIFATLIDRTPDLAGVYSLGTGNRVLTGVLERRGLAGRVVMIAHELTPNTRAALESGTVAAVIHQDVHHIVRSALRILRAKSDGTNFVASQERIRIEILLRENLI
jgi:LacI family transcriptional regulator